MIQMTKTVRVLFPPLHVDFESEASDLSGNDYNGEVDGDVTFDMGCEGGPTQQQVPLQRRSS